MKFGFGWLAVLLALSAGVANAQNLSPLAGSVQDTTGAIIIGAEITVVAQDGRIIAQGTTDRAGNFRFTGLAAGTYTVVVDQPGFRQVRQEAGADSGARPQLRIILPIASVTQNVVAASPESPAQVTTDTARNQDANVVDRDALDRLPVFDQDYITTMSRFVNADATGTNGVALVVNGIEANGPGVTASAIQSVKINQNPYTALYSRPGRARIEITTAGGTPQLHGSANFLYRDSVFDARDPFAETKPAERRTYYEGSITGPLGHDKKTTFLLALDNDNDDQQAIVVAAGPEGPINTNTPNPTHHYFLSGRAFHDYGEGSQLWAGYSYEHRSVQNQGVGGTVLPEAGTDTSFLEHEINVGHIYVFSPKLLNQLHFLVGHYDSKVESLNSNPQVAVSGAFTGGGAQADARRTEYHFDGTDLVTWSAGKQEIKFGVDVPDISRRGFDDFTNRQGTYSFASLSDYQASDPFSYRMQRGQGHVTFLEKTFAGIFENNVRLAPNLSVTVGVRYYWQNYFHNVPYDLAPRLSFAYAPTKKGAFVVRGGAGFFFDRTGPAPIADLMLFNGSRLKRFIVENPSYPVTSSQLLSVPTSVVQLDPRLRIPYTVQYGIGIEKQLNARSSVSLNYVGSRGIDQFRSVDVNAPTPPGYTARPNSEFGQQRELQSEGYAKSNSLEFGFRGRPAKWFTGQGQYTLGKTYNNTTGITYFPGNSNSPSSDWSRSDNDRRHKFDLLGTLEAGRWFNFGTAVSLYSGKPVNVTTGSDDNHDGLAIERPTGLPRNSLHGPAYLSLDLNLAHDFLLTKAKEKGPTATVSVNAFNVLNHENDVTYVGVVTSPFFGRAVAAQPPRRMQLDMQFKF